MLPVASLFAATLAASFSELEDVLSRGGGIFDCLGGEDDLVRMMC